MSVRLKLRRIGLVVLTLVSIGLWLTPTGGQQPSGPGDFIPGEIIVKFKRSADAAHRGALMSARGARILKHFDQMELTHVRVGRGGSVAALIAQLRGDQEVEFAQPNFVYRVTGPATPLPLASGPPNDPYWLNNSLWGLIKIAAAQAWSAAGAGDGSVIIANIDSGVQYTHPDLAANMWQNALEIPGNTVDDDLNGYIDDVFGIDTAHHDSDPNDDHGHGTHTAGTIAAVGNNNLGVAGVNWNAKILACKFTDAAGNGSDASAIECLNYIVALKQDGQNIRVTNNSWGALRTGGPSAALKLAFDNAGNAGILNVAASGNDNVNTDVQPFDPASFTSSSIVSVAASDQSDARASFSNFGSVSVDLAAPGVSIASTTMGNMYGNSSGTSMAAPHVAGVAALLASIDPTLTVDNLKVLLMQNADVLPQWAGLSATGGRLNAFRAVSAIAPAGAGTSAVFAGVDSPTAGNWFNLYGADGYSIVGDATALPAYATLTQSGATAFVWNGASSEARALRRAVPPGRLAAAWYAGTQFDLNIGLADGQPHTIAIYCLDYDQVIRSQRFEVFDASTNALLDSQTIGTFSGGKYVVWTITGNVRIRVTRLAGNNAVVSGVFFGSAPSGNLPPTVAITSPAPSATFAFGASIPITANAADPDGTVASVAFYADGQLLNTDTISPFAFTWPNAGGGNHTLTAVATDNGGQPTTSAPVAISVTAPAGGASAVFASVDATTQGNWSTLYGAAGYSIVGDATSLPGYATLTPSGATAFVWNGASSEARALQRAIPPGRLAAAWYSGTQFDLNIGLADGQPHTIALYCLDYDQVIRSQRLDVFDASTNVLLNSQTVSNFSGGKYVVWTITGNVRIQVTRLAGSNAVVSGVFFGGAPSGNLPPTVAITSPAPNATFAFGAAIPITANAADPDGTVASVAFYADGQLLNTDTISPFAFSWPNASGGNHTLTAVATDNGGQPTTSAPVAITVTAPAGGASAVFQSVDAATQGNWFTLYGSAGYSIVGDVTSLPGYATLTPSGASTFVWNSSSSEPRALRRAIPPGRVAGTWYSGTQFDLNIGLADGQPHTIALYCLDYDQVIRSQRLDVFDASTNALLNSQTISNFSGGKYVVWTITGNVRIQVTRLAGANAVVSGVFFGGAPSGNQAPTVAITGPAPGATFAFGAAIPITANAADPDGTVASVAFYANGQLLNTDTVSPFAFSWPNASGGNHTLTAVATDNSGQPTTSAPVAITVTAPAGGASVVFAGIDAATQGDWFNLYGAAGYSIVGDAISLPGYATLTPSGASTFVWNGATTELRALRRAVPPGRVAGTWYSGTQFDLNIGLADGQPHTIALYCLDYDQVIRSQRLEVFDASTNALLDSQTIGTFSGGKYVVWTITGNVRIRVTRLAGNNAVVSGVFFGNPPPANQPLAISPSTITLRADLIGTLGAGGNATSPIAAGPHLLLLNQTGSLYRWTGAAAQQILSIASAPPGVAPFGSEAIVNVAANATGTNAFVMFTSSTAPASVPQHVSPRPGANAWQVLYKYDFDGTVLSNPVPIVALHVRSDGHTGGGMVVLSDGSVLFATGDNGDAGEDGTPYAQDPGNHLSKILRINPSTLAVTLLATGVRNVQRLFVNPNGSDPRLEFVDLGGAIAEEFNSVRIADLLVGPVENFGWGRNADGLAREGTFYIDFGGAATGVAPTPEAGFVQPVAQFGREGAQLVGVTGTVSSTASFTNITALFGDLPSGNVLAVIGAPGTPGQIVYRVNLVDSTLAPVTLTGLAGGRPDPRFFLFADGTAGVLVERTGAFYRLTQIGQ